MKEDVYVSSVANMDRWSFSSRFGVFCLVFKGGNWEQIGVMVCQV